MKTKSTTLLVTALLGLGVTANAVAVTVYTDRTAFEAAFLSAPTIETFEHYENGGMPPTFSDPADPIIDPDPHLSGDDPNGLKSLDLYYFELIELTAEEPTIKIGSELVYPDQYAGSENTTPGGSQFLYLDTDESKQGSETVFGLGSSVNAFGFDYTGVFEAGTAFTVTIGSDIFNPNQNNGEDDPRFWGVIGPASFNTVTLSTITDSTGFGDSGYGVDDVTFGSAIPLPPALWLFGSGLLALAGSGMKKKIHS